MLSRCTAGLALVGWAGLCLAHGTPEIAGVHGGARPIVFPDTARYLTLVLDPHTHSVFSDGHVWPRIRVGEALLDGLDAMAVTEHLEYQPHLADMPNPDRNRAYEATVAAAEGSDLMVIAGSEITRDAPAGHMNAIFIEDANKLFEPPPESSRSDVRAYYQKANEWPAQNAVQAANDQGAFVFWNHPYWTRDFPNGIPVVPDFHARNAREGLLHGIEIANGDSYSEETFRIALAHDLTLMGVSDVHNLIDWDYEPHLGGHRPVTLVLAEARTPTAIREALFDGRTVVYFKHLLIGRPRHLEPLLAACLSLEEAAYEGDSQILTVTLRNRADTPMRLENRSDYTFFDNADQIEVPAQGTLSLRVKTGTRVGEITLPFVVLNALTAPGEHPAIALSAQVAVRAM